MNNPIVSSLFKNRPKLEFLEESVKPINEAEADDEYAELNDEDTEEEEHDDSQAPEQGKPDDEEEDNAEDALADKMPSSSHGSLSSHAPEPPAEEEPEEEIPEEKPERNQQDPEGYENPLDNQYAVKFTLGDEILLAYTGATIEPKKGMIDGYDTEGFYRIKWSDGSTTNGLTDIALAELVDNNKPQTQNESKCACGCKDFVRENDQMVCDRCGRIRESEDPLMLADKSRPKGKRMIRSEAHPISTATRPNISMAETIKKAFQGKQIREEDDTEIEESPFDDLKKLDNEFWTRQEEMQSDIEELGFTVEEINSEYVIVSSDEDEDNVYKIPVAGTSRTMTLDISKARMI